MLKPNQVASEIRKGVNAKIADGRSLYLVVRGGRGYRVHEYRDGKVRRSRGLGYAAKVVRNPATWDVLQDVLSRKTLKAKAHASMSYQDVPAFMVDLANTTTRRRRPGAGRWPSVPAADYGTVSRCLRFTILTAVRSG